MNKPCPSVCVFTTVHPIGDVRVESKVARSFIDYGWLVKWIGPDRRDFPRAGTNPSIAFNLVRYSGSRAGRFKAIPELVRLLINHRNIDLIYCPDPDSAAIATFLRPVHRRPIVFDIHENYHEGTLRHWTPRFLYPALSRIVRRAIITLVRTATLSTAVNEDIAQMYSSIGHRPAVLRNLARETFSDGASTTQGRIAKGDQTIFFHGKASQGNGTGKLLEAWAHLRDRPDLKLAVIPRLAGAAQDLMPELSEKIRELDIEQSVLLLPAVSHDEMPTLLDTMDVGMIAYQRDLGVESLPNRFFEYLARGLPTLTPSYSRHLTHIVERAQCGTVVDMEDPRAIARAARKIAAEPGLRSEMGSRGLSTFRNELSWESEFSRFYAALANLGIPR